MTTDDQSKKVTVSTGAKTMMKWWLLPLIIVGGQLLMRLTGYSAWSESVGQEFMFTLIFYLAIFGVLLGSWSVMQFKKQASQNAA